MLGHQMPGALAPLAHEAARAGSKNTTASAAIAPPLVAPNDSTSTPAFQVASAGETFMRASALPKRAPSICTAMPCACAISASAAISSDAVDRAGLGGLRDRQRRRH